MLPSEIVNAIQELTLNTFASLDKEDAGLGLIGKTTLDYKMIRDVLNFVVNVDGISPGHGLLNTEIILGTEGNRYNPGWNSADPFYAACQYSKNSRNQSYYSTVHFEENTDFNVYFHVASPNKCQGRDWCKSDEIIVHNWCNRMTEAILEIYGRSEGVGSARVVIKIPTRKVHMAHDRAWAFLGQLTLPHERHPNYAFFEGMTVRNSLPVANQTLSFFQMHEIRGFPIRTGRDRQYKAMGFARSDEHGMFKSTPLFPGKYRMYRAGAPREVELLNIGGKDLGNIEVP